MVVWKLELMNWRTPVFSDESDTASSTALMWSSVCLRIFYHKIPVSGSKRFPREKRSVFQADLLYCDPFPVLIISVQGPFREVSEVPATGASVRKGWKAVYPSILIYGAFEKEWIWTSCGLSAVALRFRPASYQYFLSRNQGRPFCVFCRASRRKWIGQMSAEDQGFLLRNAIFACFRIDFL